MTPHQIKLVQTSFAQVAPIAATAADLFYGRLFEIAPEVRAMFPDDLSAQKKKLMAMLGTVVAGLSHVDTTLPAVRALGKRHAGYGVTAEIEEAWSSAYTMLAGAMIDAGREMPKAA